MLYVLGRMGAGGDDDIKLLRMVHSLKPMNRLFLEIST